MPVLNTANKVYAGGNAAAKVYLGSNLVWSGAAPAIVAPVFRAKTNRNYPGGVGMIFVDKPAGTVENDIILVGITHVKSGGSAQNDLVPSNAWNKIGVSSVVTDGGLTAKLEVWWRRATASEPASYGFDVWGSNQNEYYAASYSGCPTSGSPVDAFSQNGANTGSTATGLSVTTTQANDKLIYLGHNWSASGTLNPPVGMTERHDFISYSADETIALAGATGNRTQAQAASSPWAAFLIALKGK